MKKTVNAFYKYTIKMQKYTQDKKDYYLRCLMHFFVRYTYLNPIDLYNELEKQIDESKDYNQTFLIDGKEWWICLEKDLNDYISLHDRE